MNPLDLMKQAAKRVKDIKGDENDEDILAVAHEAPESKSESIELPADTEVVDTTEASINESPVNIYSALDEAMSDADARLQAPAGGDFDEIESMSNFVTSSVTFGSPAGAAPNNSTPTDSAPGNYDWGIYGKGRDEDKYSGISPSTADSEMNAAEPFAALDVSEQSFAIEGQEYFSGSGVLPDNAYAERARLRLDSAKDGVRVASYVPTPVDDVPDESTAESVSNPAESNNPEQPASKDPLAQSIYAVASLVSAPVSAIAGVPGVLMDRWRNWQSQEQRFSRYNAKSTKAIRATGDNAAEMLLSGLRFKDACKSANISHAELDRANFNDIVSALGDEGDVIRKAYTKFSKDVVKHEESLIKLDAMTASALRDGTLGLNTLARQNDSIRSYRDALSNKAGLIEDIPMFGAKDELDKKTSLSEKLQEFRDKLNSGMIKGGDFMKGLFAKLGELLERLKTYIAEKVADIKEQVSFIRLRSDGEIPEDLSYSLPSPSTP